MHHLLFIELNTDRNQIRVHYSNRTEVFSAADAYAQNMLYHYWHMHLSPEYDHQIIEAMF